VKIDEHRIEVITHLKYIKEKVDDNHRHLKELNGRVRKNEASINWIKGVGTVVGFLFTSVIAYFIKE